MPGGRPKGSKDSRSRIRRRDVLTARRAQWDEWAKDSGTLRAARRRLLEIIEDPQAPARDTLKAIELLWKYVHRKPRRSPERRPEAVLDIVR